MSSRYGHFVKPLSTPFLEVNPTMTWKPSLYDEKQGYVSEYGKGLLDYLPTGKRLNILDLGCGTGTLAGQMAIMGHDVLGCDASPEMIAKAKAAFPDIQFAVMDALTMDFDQVWDIVFSNAVFHWIPDHHTLLENIYRALKPEGLLICEFGADGNIQTIENAFQHCAMNHAFQYQTHFHFETAERFGALLEVAGFKVESCYTYDRPTPLQGEEGIRDFVRQFYAKELAVLPDAEQQQIAWEMDALLKPVLWDGKQWIADYKRLRAVASRP